MKFLAFGHKNILGKHWSTVEFTKDKELTKNGDCIIGVDSDFKLSELRQYLKKNKKIKIILKVDDLVDEITAEANPTFYNKHEMVIRRSDYIDQRTFAINASKSAHGISRKLIEKMKDPQQKMEVFLE